MLSINDVYLSSLYYRATYEIAPVFTILERKIIEYCGRKCGWDHGSIDGIFSPGKMKMSNNCNAIKLLIN